MRRRRIFFAGFLARMEDMRLPKCVMFGEVVRGAGCVGGQEKEWMGCFLDDLRALDVNADQWTTAAQDEGEWCKTAEQETRRFKAKWTTVEKVRAGLQHVVVCPNVTERPTSFYPLSPFVPESLFSRNGSSRPVPRQPVHSPH